MPRDRIKDWWNGLTREQRIAVAASLSARLNMDDQTAPWHRLSLAEQVHLQGFYELTESHTVASDRTSTT